MKIEETLKRKFERLLIDTAGNEQTNHQSRASLERLLRISELESTEVWYSVVTRLRKRGAYVSRRIFRGHEITSRMNASLELLRFDAFTINFHPCRFPASAGKPTTSARATGCTNGGFRFDSKTLLAFHDSGIFPTFRDRTFLFRRSISYT